MKSDITNVTTTKGMSCHTGSSRVNPGSIQVWTGLNLQTCCNFSTHCEHSIHVNWHAATVCDVQGRGWEGLLLSDGNVRAVGGTSNKLEMAVGAPGIIVINALLSCAHHQPLACVSVGHPHAHVPIHPVYHSHHYLHPPFVAPRLSVVQFVNLQNQVWTQTAPEVTLSAVRFGAGSGTKCLNLNPHLWVWSRPLPNLNPEVRVRFGCKPGAPEVRDLIWCHGHFLFSSPLSSYLLILSLDLIHSQVPDHFMDYY